MELQQQWTRHSQATYAYISSNKILLEFALEATLETKLPPNISCFTWKVLKGACLTQENLIKRGFQLVKRFHMCQNALEELTISSSSVQLL